MPYITRLINWDKEKAATALYQCVGEFNTRNTYSDQIASISRRACWRGLASFRIRHVCDLLQSVRILCSSSSIHCQMMRRFFRQYEIKSLLSLLASLTRSFSGVLLTSTIRRRFMSSPFPVVCRMYQVISPSLAPEVSFVSPSLIYNRYRRPPPAFLRIHSRGPFPTIYVDDQQVKE